jgi:hypothetical protein
LYQEKPINPRAPVYIGNIEGKGKKGRTPEEHMLRKREN